MTDLPALIEKLRGLKGPDREVDAEIIKGLYPDIGDCTPLCAGDEPIFWREPFYKQPCPPLTSSLDAIVALIGREMPHGYDIWARRRPTVAMVYWSEDDGAKATAYTPAIALLLAFLTAKMEMEK